MTIIRRTLPETDDINVLRNEVQRMFDEVINEITRPGPDLYSRPFTAAHTLEISDVTNVEDATGGAYSVTLPPAAAATGRTYWIKRTNGGGNNVTIDGDGAELIDGVGTKVLTVQYQSVGLVSDGVGWSIVDSHL